MTNTEREGRVISYIYQYKDLNASQLAEKILSIDKEVSEGSTHKSLKLLIQRSRRELGISIEKPLVKVEKIQEREKYKVIDSNYHFFSQKGEFQLSVEFIDNLFYEYSEHGLNLSQTEMINKHNLQVWEWNCIKNALWLYKKSHIFSPHTVNTTPKTELESLIQGKMDGLFSNVGLQVEQKYQKAVYKKYKEVIESDNRKKLEVQSLALELQDLLPKIELSTKHYIEDGQEKENTILTVHIADLHFGSENRTPQLPQYSPEIAKNYLQTIANVVNKVKANEVHLFFIGDSIETFSGSNHPDSWKGVAKGYYGSRVVIETYKVLADFISSIHNVKCIYGVPGNHDRAAADKKQEHEGFIAELIFEFLRLSLNESVEIVYNEKLVSVTIDDIHYIMTHGDKKLTDLPAAELILEYGVQGKYNLLVSGHLHSRKIKADSKNFRQIVCPALFPGNDYSVDLGYQSAPGFIIVQNNGSGKPTILDYCL